MASITDPQRTPTPVPADTPAARTPATAPESGTLPPIDAVLSAARVVAIPTRTRFRGIEVREAVVFDAPRGPSEFSPFPEYDDAEAASWLAAALDFGWGEAPPPLRDTIAVNATVPAVAAEEVAGILARFPGCTTAKVKVAERGQSLADDIARVRAVREAMGEDALIRIDANGGWTVDEAAHALRTLSEFDLDYAEQPCVTVPELVELRHRLTTGRRADDGQAEGRRAEGERAEEPGFLADAAFPASAGRSPLVRIAADESVRKAEDPLAVARAGAADLLVVKAQPLGGVGRALRIVEEAGLPVVVSSALDTSAGISMGLRLAAALPEHLLAGACGLGTVALLQGDVAADPLVPVDGRLRVRRPALDPELLDRYAASPEREAWWRERIARCRAVLDSRGSRL
ncbi:o-succinylbenzoate synthase [Leucobacter sp. CSA1]|uniref:o-succinylbenzoate synthase n=1 Tax=Leucobacter chromiisoli TaxID=2796471 RepID=A0A934Q913_9MICO|nr:o-succinylbenzoate synthase [Leucobacter chromiisoli]MBK0418869.1 o-succinylbenzoate synthase [Leucobacter chromiisoli]